MSHSLARSILPLVGSLLLLVSSAKAIDSPTLTEGIANDPFDIQQALSSWADNARLLGDFRIKLALQPQRPFDAAGDAPEQFPYSTPMIIQRSDQQLLLVSRSIAPTELLRGDRPIGEIFEAALEARFQGSHQGPHLRDYQVVRDFDTEEHSWQSSSSGPSIVVRCLPGEFPTHFTASLHTCVLEAFAWQCAMPIGPFRTAPIEYEVLADKKSVSAKTCRVVKVWINEKTKRRLIRELWVEQEVGYRIRRCVIPGKSMVIIQFGYSSGPENQLLNRIELIRLDDIGDVADELVALCIPNTDSVPLSRKPVAKGDIVTDLVHSKRGIVGENGVIQRIPTSSIRSDRSDLRQQSIWKRFYANGLWLTVVPWLKWPRIIVSFGVMSLLYWIMKRSLLRIQNKENNGLSVSHLLKSMGQDSPDLNETKRNMDDLTT